MRISPKQLALSLYESVEGKSAAQVKAVIAKFIELLAEKNMLGASDKIASQFIKIWNEKHGIVEVLATSVNALDKTSVGLLKKYVAKLSGAKEVLISEKTDKDILGGVVIKYGDRVVDGSLRTRLAELKISLIK